jgi:phage repressor protein C with HTH and peptisase S24 domain
MMDANKFIQIRELAGLNQGAFARELGLTRELVNKIESGKTRLTKRTSKRVQQFIEQRQGGEFSHDVNILGGASQIERKMARSQPYYLFRREQKNEETLFLVPLVGIKAQAGYIRGFEETDYVETLDKYSLPPGVNPTGAIWRYFEIDGESMEPTFNCGDVVLGTMVPHEDWHDIRNFSIYVILTNDQLLIKRIYKKSESEWVLISDNEETNPQVLLPVENVKQLWLFRRHIRSRVPQPKDIRITA